MGNFYVNLDLSLVRNGGRKAVTMTTDGFKELINHIPYYDRKGLMGNAKLDTQTKIASMIWDEYSTPICKKLVEDLMSVDVSFENFNIESIGSTSTGIPYMHCEAGGDWECPLNIFIYFDGTHFRGYIPKYGNTYDINNKKAYQDPLDLLSSRWYWDESLVKHDMFNIPGVEYDRAVADKAYERYKTQSKSSDDITAKAMGLNLKSKVIRNWEDALTKLSYQLKGNMKAMLLDFESRVVPSGSFNGADIKAVIKREDRQQRSFDGEVDGAKYTSNYTPNLTSNKLIISSDKLSKAMQAIANKMIVSDNNIAHHRNKVPNYVLVIEKNPEIDTGISNVALLLKAETDSNGISLLYANMVEANKFVGSVKGINILSETINTVLQRKVSVVTVDISAYIDGIVQGLLINPTLNMLSAVLVESSTGDIEVGVMVKS